MRLEDATVQVFLFGTRWVQWETVVCTVELVIAHLVLRVRFERVDPAVPDAVGKLLFLSPHDGFGEHRLERAPKHLFLHAAVANHLVGGVETHGNLEELEVQERHACLDAPRRHRLVRAQTVIAVEVEDFAHRLVVKRAPARGPVKVEIAAENLIGAFTR